MKDKIKGLFFNETLRRWHFEDIVKESYISRERVNYFLKELLREGFIKRIKPRYKRPYYLTNRESIRFRSEKKIYGIRIIEQSGLFDHLNSLNNIKTAILFGSFSRGNWNKSSDIDLFLYGDDKDFDKGMFEKKIKREIQLFSYKDIKKMKKEIDPRLFQNIVKGFNIKESIIPFEVKLNG
ncbi:nucleotidyltransferase domain-containing protein [Candidatus Woesearchaeota archaeon]|nr:nucleotidyltransferase domain-containing protein [Candidatus Woesearchaeota archaeon]